VYVPRGAPLEVSRKVDVPEPETDDGVKLEVTPLGSLEIDRVTEPVKPPLGVMVTVEDAVPAFLDIWSVEGDALIEKLPVTGGLTVNETVVLCEILAPVPVIVTVAAPVVAVALAVSVSVELPPLVTEVGLNEAVTPPGSPLAESATDWAEPLVIAVLIEVVTF